VTSCRIPWARSVGHGMNDTGNSTSRGRPTSVGSPSRV
jgi:hypothetical protein